MKEKKTGSHILDLAGKIAKREAVKTNSGWPPACAGILHQPKRPVKK
jgi:cyclic lactone autoinducer peptide